MIERKGGLLREFLYLKHSGLQYSFIELMILWVEDLGKAGLGCSMWCQLRCLGLETPLSRWFLFAQSFIEKNFKYTKKKK